MESIQHFSHEHPLNLFQVDDLDDPKPYRCCICGLPILSSPSYTCSIDANCNFFLHIACTQLPREMFYLGHLETLNLERPPLSQSYYYRCRKHSDCEFEVHPLVAKPVLEIMTNHISHLRHPLVVRCREMVSQCDGCGEEQKGFFFHCQKCNFWIHQDCTILPTVVKLLNQLHPYILSYSPPFNPLNQICSICRKPWHLYYNGVYFQAELQDLVHVTCAKSNMENLPDGTMREFILELPDEEDTFPSLAIRRSAERNPDSSARKYHKHPLILEDGSTSREDACCDLVCDVCIQPIDRMMSSPFYRCQSNGCDFLAHDTCANHLPTNIQLLYAQRLIRKVFPLQDSYSNKIFFNSVFPCVFCLRPTNGIIYAFSVEGTWGFCDAECALAPKVVKHASHRQHLLLQLTDSSDTPLRICCCSRGSIQSDVYKCIICDFNIHVRCALLPKRTRHKFDEHPLKLITSHDHNEDNKQVLFCEVCEQEIELKWWYYGCRECEQYFHIDCIPSVGHTSKVKFGKTFCDDRVHPQHPLTLTRMLTHERDERCGVCNQIIRGFSDDEMAFHCSPCHFWVHFSCASATTGSINYSQLLKSFKDIIENYK